MTLRTAHALLKHDDNWHQYNTFVCGLENAAACTSFCNLKTSMVKSQALSPSFRDEQEQLCMQNEGVELTCTSNATINRLPAGLAGRRQCSASPGSSPIQALLAPPVHPEAAAASEEKLPVQHVKQIHAAAHIVKFMSALPGWVTM
jgi:hypothetical protein